MIYENTPQLRRWLEKDFPQKATRGNFEFDDAEYQGHLAKVATRPEAERADAAAFRCLTFNKQPEKVADGFTALEERFTQLNVDLITRFNGLHEHLDTALAKHQKRAWVRFAITALLILALMALLATSAHAQNVNPAIVVPVCGAAPTPYPTAGGRAPETVDVNGNLCAGVTVSATVSTAGLAVNFGAGTSTGPAYPAAVFATSAAPSYTNGTVNPLSSDLSGNLRVNASVTVPGSLVVSTTTGGTGGQVAVVGVASDGTAATFSPIRVGGVDGTGNIQDIRTDNNGLVGTYNTSVSTTSLGPPSQATYVAGLSTGINGLTGIQVDDNGIVSVSCTSGCSGSSGTNITQVGGKLVPNNGSGALAVVGIVSSGTVAVGGPVIVGGLSGTAAQTLTVSTTGGGLKVDGSGYTQPVSGTVTVTDGAGALNVIVDSGTTTVTQGTGTNLHTVVDSGAVTVSGGTVAIQGVTGGVAVTIAGQTAGTITTLVTDTTGRQVVVGSANSGQIAQGAPVMAGGSDGTNVRTLKTATDGTLQVGGTVTVTDGAGALNVIVDSGAVNATVVNTAGAPVIASIQSNGVGVTVTAGNALKVDGSAVTQPVSGTVTVTDGAGALNVIVDSGTITSIGSTVNVQGVTGGVAVAIAGQTGGTQVEIVTDTTGRQVVVGAANSGQIAQGAPVMAGGSDGTNVRTLRTATDGTLRVDPTGTTTQPVSGTVSVGNTVNVNFLTSSIAVTCTGCSSASSVTVSTTSGGNGGQVSVVGVVSDGTAASFSPVWTAGVDDSGITQAFRTTAAGNTVVSIDTTSGVIGHVVCDSGCTPGGSFADNAAFTVGSTAINNAGGVFNDATADVTAGNAAAQRITKQRAGQVNLRDSNGLEIGTMFNPVAVQIVTAPRLPTTATATPQATQILGTFNRPVQSTNDALNVNVVNVVDPCSGPKGSIPISQATSSVLLTQNPGRVYICGMLIVGADAENLSLVEGTGSVCGTNTAAIMGGTTAATGTNLAANGGFNTNLELVQKNPGFDVCLLQSGSGRVAGALSYVIR